MKSFKLILVAVFSATLFYRCEFFSGAPTEKEMKQITDEFLKKNDVPLEIVDWSVVPAKYESWPRCHWGEEKMQYCMNSELLSEGQNKSNHILIENTGELNCT